MTDIDNGKICGKCRYWCGTMEDREGVDAYGECRRYPPTQKRSGQIISFGEINGEAQLGIELSDWEIITHRLNWCGEWGGLCK